MAINVATAKATAIVAIKAALESEFPDINLYNAGTSQSLADIIGLAVEHSLDEVKDNADVVGVTSGSATVVGGVD